MSVDARDAETLSGGLNGSAAYAKQPQMLTGYLVGPYLSAMAGGAKPVDATRLRN